MAITKIIDAETAAIPESTATAFTLDGPSMIDCWGLGHGQSILVYKLMSDEDYHAMTSEGITVALSSVNNSIILEAGSYKLVKGITDSVTAGWEAI